MRLNYLLGIGLPALAIAAGYGFLTLFSTFLGYDDEGLFLSANRFYREDAVFYRDIFWPYGPAWFFGAAIFHDWLAVPVTHAAARWVTLGCWLGIGLLAADTVRRITGRGSWGIVAGLAVFMYIDSLANEPGHPQASVALLSVALPWLLTFRGASARSLSWCLVGAGAGLVFHLKINAGVFCLAAIAIVLAWQPGGLPRRFFPVAAVLLACAAGPFLLMLPLLVEPGSVELALLVAVATVSVAGMLLRQPGGRIVTVRRAAVAVGAGYLLVTVLALLAAWRQGASPVDVFNGLRHYAASQAAFYHFFRDYPGWQIAMAVVSAGLALAVIPTGLRDPARSVLLDLARGYVVIVALTCYALDNQANAHLLQGALLPWVWLCLAVDRNSPGFAARALLAALAAWTPLLSYPVPGTQLYLGSFPLLLVAVLCADDLVCSLARGRSGLLRGRLAAGLAPLLLLVLVLHSAFLLEQRRQLYAESVALELPGTELMRLPQSRVAQYRTLVAALEGADVVLATTGMNSLYAWSSARPPAPVYLTHSLAFLPAADQQRLRRGLEAAEHPVVVVNRRAARGQPGSAIAEWIDANFEVSRRVGPWSLLVRR